MRQLYVCLSLVCFFVGVGLAPASAEPREHVVKIFSDFDTFEMYFEPKILHIRSGDTVTWINQATMDHNVITYPNGFPEGGEPLLSPYLSNKGDSWSHTFTTSGTYEYHCLPHVTFGMHASVIVDSPSAADGFHRPSKAEVAAYRALLLEFFDESEINEMTGPADTHDHQAEAQ